MESISSWCCPDIYTRLPKFWQHMETFDLVWSRYISFLQDRAETAENFKLPVPDKTDVQDTDENQMGVNFWTREGARMRESYRSNWN